MGRAKRVVLDATLKVMKKSWPVTITSMAPKYNRYRIKKGWLEFARRTNFEGACLCVHPRQYGLGIPSLHCKKRTRLWLLAAISLFPCFVLCVERNESKLSMIIPHASNTDSD